MAKRKKRTDEELAALSPYMVFDSKRGYSWGPSGPDNKEPGTLPYWNTGEAATWRYGDSVITEKKQSDSIKRCSLHGCHYSVEYGCTHCLDPFDAFVLSEIKEVDRLRKRLADVLECMKAGMAALDGTSLDTFLNAWVK